MKICITGASGFVGSYLVDMLLPIGHHITVLTRNKDINFPLGVDVVYGDLALGGDCLYKFLTDCDVLFHCAAEISNTTNMHRTNVDGTRNLIDAISTLQLTSPKKIHWIQLSSAGIYGIHADSSINVALNLNPANEYEWTKFKSDQLLIEAVSSNLFKVSILRPTNIFGPKMKNKSLFSLIRMIDYGLFFFINKRANTNYIHVKNVCHALILLLKKSNFHGFRIYVLSDCLPITSFVSLICMALGRQRKFMEIPSFFSFILYHTVCKLPKFPLSQTRFRALSSEVTYDSKLIKKDVGYNEIITAKNGVIEMVRQYWDNQNK